MAEPTYGSDIMAWLRANGIEPTDVPLGAVPHIADGMIVCVVCLRNEHGHHYITGTGAMASTTVTVPLKVKPPAALADWLAGRVPGDRIDWSAKPASQEAPRG